jgi:hypothetical protein
LAILLLVLLMTSALVAAPAANGSGIEVLEPGDGVLTARVPRSLSFEPVAPQQKFPDGTLFGLPEFYATDTTRLWHIRLNPDFGIDLIPGTVVRVQRREIRLLKGKIIVSYPENSRGPAIMFPKCVYESHGGEIFVEKNAADVLVFGQKKGTGWVKGRDRHIVSLKAGTQVEVKRDGSVGKTADLDSRWRRWGIGLVQLAPVLYVDDPATATGEADIASETSDIASAGADLPPASLPASVQIPVESLGTVTVPLDRVPEKVLASAAALLSEHGVTIPSAIDAGVSPNVVPPQK